jgi:1-aminocyclopropane-1-carboxylate deaminase/D-cysteine desulfhydrase-like pyridoxal-dependent ACC family enzyme
MARVARAVDLVVTGGPAATGDIYSKVSTPELLISSGRPMLVVPPHGGRLDTRRIMVAWKDTREARRAVSDALSFMHMADEILIVALGDREDQDALAAQANDEGLVIDRIVTATGSAGTHAGLVAGLAVSGADIPVLGIGVRAPKQKQYENVFNLAVETAALLGSADRVHREMTVADCDYVGAGYGIADEGVFEALRLAARTEGLLLDPVYTGKAVKGLIDYARKGRWAGETVVFLHTGGAQGLAGYTSVLEGHLE